MPQELGSPEFFERYNTERATRNGPLQRES
jgi:hypothetical protein